MIGSRAAKLSLPARVPPASGERGDGSLLCSGDMLLEALVAVQVSLWGPA